MVNVSLRNLVKLLNSKTRSALEEAADLCASNTNYEIELEHLLSRLMEDTDNDVLRILRAFEVDTPQFYSDLAAAIKYLKRGNPRNPVLSPHLVKALLDAWNFASIDHGMAKVRSGFVLLAATQSESFSQVMSTVSSLWARIKPERLHAEFDAITSGSPEAAGPVPPGGGSASDIPTGTTPNLDQFTQNLTAQSRSSKLDPVCGRDREIRQMIDILMRRRQNNPILTGEAGVGKTAVVEGIAQLIAKGDVPPALQAVSLHSLDLTLLQAGAGIKGEFENRLKGLINEIKASPKPIILFIDEAHTLVGAGPNGQGDAANILKPALARGELRTIAATTWSEYKKYFERDAALARRFQVVKIDEPSEEICLRMLRAFAPSLENHHKVRILDEGLEAAVHLSSRYINGRQLPDKAVSVLDTVCARLNIAHNSTPGIIEDAQRQLDDIEIQVNTLVREGATGADHSDRLSRLAERRSSLTTQLSERQTQWAKEIEAVQSVRALRERLENPLLAVEARSPLQAELQVLTSGLAAIQGETPLLRPCVDAAMVGEVISSWTGIPVGKMLRNELQSVLTLSQQLASRIIGQDHALETIAARIKTSRANLDDPDKPVGIFLLVGPSGVGKTETALALADLLYGGERNLITINMSEFQEPHTVSTLKGAPPGYVGYGEGGVLTEAVRKRPYSVILLDEIEKAHPDVIELFYQVFDKGVMEDGEGRETVFRNATILLTTNAASELVMRLCSDPETTPSAAGLAEAIRPELIKVFKPAFLGRVTVVPYFPVRDEALKRIIQLKLDRIAGRLRNNNRVSFNYDSDLIESIARRCTEVESGARNIDNILTNTLLPRISQTMLANMVEGVTIQHVSVGVSADGDLQYSAG